MYQCTSTVCNVDTIIQFQINPGANEPIYRQLMEQLRRRVAAGQWVAGQELPSVRELSSLLAVHPMTISKAYSLLEAEGLLQRRRGLSMVIAAAHQAPVDAAEREARLQPTLDKLVAEAEELNISKPRLLALLRERLS